MTKKPSKPRTPGKREKAGPEIQHLGPPEQDQDAAELFDRWSSAEHARQEMTKTQPPTPNDQVQRT